MHLFKTVFHSSHPWTIIHVSENYENEMRFHGDTRNIFALICETAG